MQLPEHRSNKASVSIQYAHDLGAMSVLLDTIMGISQETGYADTLVINRRDKKIYTRNYIWHRKF